jgi:hypothetical protein
VNAENPQELQSQYSSANTVAGCTVGCSSQAVKRVTATACWHETRSKEACLDVNGAGRRQAVGAGDGTVDCDGRGRSRGEGSDRDGNGSSGRTDSQREGGGRGGARKRGDVWSVIDGDRIRRAVGGLGRGSECSAEGGSRAGARRQGEGARGDAIDLRSGNAAP